MLVEWLWQNSVYKHALVRIALQEWTSRGNREKIFFPIYPLCKKKKKKNVWGAEVITPWLHSSFSNVFSSVKACVRAYRQADIKVCFQVYLLWIWADSEQLHVNDCPHLVVIVGAGAVELRLAGLNDFLWRPFVCPWIAWDNPGCPYHTEGISMPSRNKDKDCWQCFIREHLHLIMICQYNIVGGGAQLKPSIGCCFSLLCKL